MELENIVANTVYLKAREGKMPYIHNGMSDRDMTYNALIPFSTLLQIRIKCG